MFLKEPMKQILIGGRNVWDHDGTRPCVRESFRKMIECRTAALGWQLYESETEVKRVYHTCKVRSCPSCGYRATLQWQREQWTQLPDIPYYGLVFMMPGPLWSIFKENRHLLHDLPILGSEAVLRRGGRSTGLMSNIWHQAFSKKSSAGIRSYQETHFYSCRFKHRQHID